jgi:hypothetical protein
MVVEVLSLVISPEDSLFSKMEEMAGNDCHYCGFYDIASH